MATEKVKHSFDYSKFNNIDVSDDEDTFHPNIEKNFNIKINRQVRDRKIGEMEYEKQELSKKDDEESKARIAELERKKIWHVGNMGEVKHERTEISGYGASDPKKDLIPGRNEGMNSDKDVTIYMEWKIKHQELLNEFVNAAGDLEKSQKILTEHGDLLVTQPHCGTYLMLSCLEDEMAGRKERMYKCAQQSQLLTHIKELATSFGRPARDLVPRWFEKVAQKDEAANVYKADVDNFAAKVRLRAIEKKKEEAEAEAARRENEKTYVAQHYYKKKEELDDEEDWETREAVPLVQAMKNMTKEQRLQMSPGGLDPLEVFEALPEEMKECFEKQDIPALVELQKTMNPQIFVPHMMNCIKAGLWSQPNDDDEEEEGAEDGAKGAEGAEDQDPSAFGPEASIPPLETPQMPDLEQD